MMRMMRKVIEGLCVFNLTLGGVAIITASVKYNNNNNKSVYP